MFNKAMGNEFRIGPIKRIPSISLSAFYGSYKAALKLELLNSPIGLSRPLYEPAINRPGLAIAGFYNYFANKRLQVIGMAENSYLESLSQEKQLGSFRSLLEHDIPGIVFSGNHTPSQEILLLANEAGVCIFRTSLMTMKFVNMATIILENEFADRVSQHGCLIDVRGTGVLLRGSSGVGKSETALGLVERGAALVADDIVHLRNVGGKLIGAAPQASRGYMEVRGLGIVNICQLFGMKSIRESKRLDFIVTLVHADKQEELSRTGLDQQRVEILGVPVPMVELPVAPGRDTARLVEVAIMQYHLKSMGVDMADEFNRNLLSTMKG